jgi:hypothetical protein
MYIQSKYMKIGVQYMQIPLKCMDKHYIVTHLKYMQIPLNQTSMHWFIT